ncbi:MAG: hypothetical protein DRI90_06950 [Deltaproteobacteria bacterium]|nr:MAG: hypothetical protein DRI90_06950 [Deltaproteobacteria bacterium]
MAQGPRRTQSAPKGTPDLELEQARVRVALSQPAHKRLKALRIRRLLAIQLDDIAAIDPKPTGPLGKDLIRIWIDLPTERRALIEVRGGERSLARRLLVIAGFPDDVAARVVAIAVAQMVRVQFRAAQRARLAPEEGPSRGPGDPHEDQRFILGGSLTGLWLPTSAPEALVGPELSLTHRRGLTGQTIYGRWLMGSGSERHARWFEVGAALDLRLSVAPAWRARLAARAGGVALGLPEASPVNGSAASPADWTVRAGALLGIEASPQPGTWIGLAVEPGATLRSLDVVDHTGRATELGGFALGVSLSVLASPWLETTAPTPPPETRRRR